MRRIRRGKSRLLIILDYPQTALEGTVQVPPISINVYEFDIENA